MTLQNRVLPDGSIVSNPERGALMGNRGILHDANRQLGTARWRHKAWVCCLLSFKGRRRALMSPNKYTELFFLDEAVSLAAGHRPCAECRRADHLAFVDAWETSTGTRPKAAQMDAALHPARVTRTREQVTITADAASLPNGTFVQHDGTPHMLWRDMALPFSPAGYGPACPRPDGGITVLTPQPTVAVLSAGYRPKVHETASPHIS